MEEPKTCTPVPCPDFTEEHITVTHVYERCEACGGTGQGEETVYRGMTAYFSCRPCDGYGAIVVPVSAD